MSYAFPKQALKTLQAVIVPSSAAFLGVLPRAPGIPCCVVLAQMRSDVLLRVP